MYRDKYSVSLPFVSSQNFSMSLKHALIHCRYMSSGANVSEIMLVFVKKTNFFFALQLNAMYEKALCIFLIKRFLLPSFNYTKPSSVDANECAIIGKSLFIYQCQ